MSAKLVSGVGKPKGGIHVTREQKSILKDAFKFIPYPDHYPDSLSKLSDDTGLEQDAIKRWFRSRRKKVSAKKIGGNDENEEDIIEKTDDNSSIPLVTDKDSTSEKPNDNSGDNLISAAGVQENLDIENVNIANANENLVSKPVQDVLGENNEVENVVNEKDLLSHRNENLVQNGIVNELLSESGGNDLDSQNIGKRVQVNVNNRDENVDAVEETVKKFEEKIMEVNLPPIPPVNKTVNPYNTNKIANEEVLDKGMKSVVDSTLCDDSNRKDTSDKYRETGDVSLSKVTDVDTTKNSEASPNETDEIHDYIDRKISEGKEKISSEEKKPFPAYETLINKYEALQNRFESLAKVLGDNGIDIGEVPASQPSTSRVLTPDKSNQSFPEQEDQIVKHPSSTYTEDLSRDTNDEVMTPKQEPNLYGWSLTDSQVYNQQWQFLQQNLGIKSEYPPFYQNSAPYQPPPHNWNLPYPPASYFPFQNYAQGHYPQQQFPQSGPYYSPQTPLPVAGCSNERNPLPYPPASPSQQIQNQIPSDFQGENYLTTPQSLGAPIQCPYPTESYPPYNFMAESPRSTGEGYGDNTYPNQKPLLKKRTSPSKQSRASPYTREDAPDVENTVEEAGNFMGVISAAKKSFKGPRKSTERNSKIKTKPSPVVQNEAAHGPSIETSEPILLSPVIQTLYPPTKKQSTKSSQSTRRKPVQTKTKLGAQTKPLPKSSGTSSPVSKTRVEQFEQSLQANNPFRKHKPRNPASGNKSLPVQRRREPEIQTLYPPIKNSHPKVLPRNPRPEVEVLRGVNQKSIHKTQDQPRNLSRLGPIKTVPGPPSLPTIPLINSSISIQRVYNPLTDPNKPQELKKVLSMTNLSVSLSGRN